MEWVVKLEAKSGWGEVETIEVGRLERRVVGLTAEEVGLTLAEGKNLLGELARLVLQTQMEEFTTCARVCRDCLKLRRLRDQRTRKIQTLFGTITVDAPRISACPCGNSWGFVDVFLSPLAELLPDRCTSELRHLQAELSARHSYREAARLLDMFLPCGPVNHATMRNRTHRVATDVESAAATSADLQPDIDPSAETMVVIEGRTSEPLMAINRDTSTSPSEKSKWPEGAHDALLLHRRVRKRLWRHCARRFGNKDGSLAVPSRC